MPTDDVEFLDFPQPKFIALSTDATDSSSASRSMSGCHNRYFSTTKRIFRRLGAIPRFAVHPRLSQSKRSVGKIGYHGSRPEFVAARAANGAKGDYPGELTADSLRKSRRKSTAFCLFSKSLTGVGPAQSGP
jgi:hypothetical protein